MEEKRIIETQGQRPWERGTLGLSEEQEKGEDGMSREGSERPDQVGPVRPRVIIRTWTERESCQKILNGRVIGPEFVFERLTRADLWIMRGPRETENSGKYRNNPSEK